MLMGVDVIELTDTSASNTVYGFPRCVGNQMNMEGAHYPQAPVIKPAPSWG